MEVRDNFLIKKGMANNFYKISNLVPIIKISNTKYDKTIVVSASFLNFVLMFLKKHINLQYSVLSCISGVDFFDSQYRFSVVYELVSLVYSTRLRVKIFINEIALVRSICNIFINANWWEREIWDLFGIYFTRHPDLRRILTDYGFEGYPMRKDFPLSGFYELRYDLSQKRVVFEVLELAQEFRYFAFENPWA